MKSKVQFLSFCSLFLFVWNSIFFVEPHLLHNENAVADPCNRTLHAFAYNTAQFTLCSILHAHPIKLCELCVKNYTNVQESYEDIMKLEDDKGELCKKKFINVDRLAILENGHDFVQNLWLNGNCQSCFEVINGSMTENLRNETKKFQNCVQDVDKCILNHYENGSYNNSVCKDCNNVYNDMNEFYENLKETQGEESICIDIVDSVNATRAKWNEILHCGRKKMKLEIELVAVLLLASLLPIVFYVSTKQLTSRSETRLSQQKRLVQTFPSGSSLNS